MDKYLFQYYLDEVTKNTRRTLSKNIGFFQLSAITNYLIEKILNVSLSSLIQDIHNLKDSGELPASSPESQYTFYDNQFNHGNYINVFFSKYPVLKERIQNINKQTIIFVSEINSRLEKDETILKSLNPKFLLVKPLKLHFSLGDTHNQGKSVVIIEDINHEKIVYKPHSLANEVTFNGTLKILNETKMFDFKTLKNIDKEDYGWQEYLEQVIPNSEFKRKRYYYNLGRLTSLCYFLTISDIHYDNILICDDSPVFYDLETFISAKKTNIKKPNMINSVLNTAILPVNYSEVFGSVDTSGLFGNFNLKNEYFPKKELSDEFTSNIKIEEIIGKIFKKSDFDTALSTMNPQNYKENFIKGFTDCSTFLLEHKGVLISLTENLFNTNNLNRIIIRDTQTYMEFIEASINANYLSSSKQESDLFCILKENEYIDKKIIENEIEQLKRGDVPYFYHSLFGTSLMSGKDIVVTDYFSNSIIDNLKEHIANITEKDISFQISIIEKSFLLVDEPVFSNNTYSFDNVTKYIDYSKKDILEFCTKYLDTLLEKNAFFDNTGSLNILSLKLFPQSNLQGIDCDLYENFGIIMPFLKLYEITGEEKYTKIIEEIFDRSYNIFQSHVLSENLSISPFSGIGSILYVAVYKYKLIKNELLIQQISNIIQECFSIINKTTNIEYIDGLSGFIVCLINVSKIIDLPILRPLLVESIIKYKKLLNQPYKLDGLGLAHGSVGLIYALATVYKKTKDDEIMELLIKVSEEIATEKFTNINSYTWCRGTTGILGVLYEVKNIINNKRFDDIFNEIRNHINYFELLKVNGVSLCHGLSGNISLLNYINEDIKNMNVSIRNQELSLYKVFTSSVISSEGELPLGYSKKINCKIHTVDGLMLGGAGVIYTLLDSISNDHEANVLMLTL